MSTQIDNSFRTFQASGTISAFLAVSVQSDGTITPATYGVRPVGITQEDIADGAYGNIKLFPGGQGTFDIQVTGTAVTPGVQYSIVTGGYVGPVNGTTAPAYVTALYTGVASNGIVIEFAKY